MLIALAGLWYLIALACGIASLVFFIMVLVQMFKRDQSTMGIVCIVLTFCGGIGPLVAFVFGWMKATEWNLKKIMMYWTTAIVVQLICMVLVFATMAGVAATMDMDEFEIDPDNMNFEFDIEESEFEMPEGFDALDSATFDEPTTDGVAEPVE